jgi:DNA polymerase-3 subunit gamma/tau
LQQVWNEFVEGRKMYQAEYYLLSQPIEINENKITVHLHNPIQETQLNTIKSDLLTYLREKLNNNTILLYGELKEVDDKKIAYTPREKFDKLVEQNPKLKDLKERLGLDTDF